MSEELTKLKLKRGQIKASLTRFQTFLETIDVDHIDQNKTTQINARLEKIQPLFEEFTECQYKIEEIAPDLNKESQELFNFENEYFDAVSRATVMVNTSEAHQSQNPSQGSNASVNSSHNKNDEFSCFSIKLPEMKLPKFSGSYEQWIEFRDAFCTMIDQNNSLKPIQKFYYLRAHLEGEALQMIESVKVTDQNYAVALSLLRRRYENNKLIIFTYVKALFEAPPVTRESYIDLRNLFNTFNKNLSSLEALGQSTDEWSILLIYLLTSKFDNRTRRDWESYKYQGELPTLKDINEFLRERCDLLEKLQSVKGEAGKLQVQPKSFYKGKSAAFPKAVGAHLAYQGDKFVCFYCGKSHSIFKCNSFLRLDLNKRNTEAKRLQLCLNCLNPRHSVQECTKPPCKKCLKQINSLLHIDGRLNTADSQHSRLEHHENTTGIIEGSQTQKHLTQNSQERQVSHFVQENRSNSANIALEPLDKKGDEVFVYSQSALLGQTNKYALLSTAVVLVQNNRNIFKARMLLDPGSQSNFITESFCRKVGLGKQKVNITVSGIGNNESTSTNFKTNFQIKAYNGKFSKEISCLILPKITQPMPMCNFDSSFLNIPNEIELADPAFNVKGEIDILCGVGLFYEILVMEQIKLNKHLRLQATKLGWVLGGELNFELIDNNKILACLSIEETINKNLKRFWEIEEVENVEQFTDVCEEHFKNTFRRHSNGRFVVKIPFKENKVQLGNSKRNAIKCFAHLERRISKNSELKREYDEFMNEYERLGHMSLLTNNLEELSDCDREAYYMSHHAVVKSTSLTTRVRVVFNGSAASDNGVSLNDIQYTGPTIQNDLMTILLNFRRHVYVLNADISKMYRHIIVDEADRRYQRIFWRSNPMEELKCYELNVVTYGLASSPFLATRCLLQLALDHEKEYPFASKVIKECFYMDDLLTGSDEKSELLQLQKDVSKILSSAGFELRKYLSNAPELFNQFNINSSLDVSILRLAESENNKTLGVYWNAHSDTVEYQVRDFSEFASVTKRSILSMTGQIFDSLGLLGPVIIRAKIILQMLWKNKLSWDEEITGAVRQKWISFCKDLVHVNQIKIPRHVFSKPLIYVELHTFCDASETSYGTCVYIRCKLIDGTFSCKLIAAKSKVAPVRPVTLPRLELTSAVLGCKLAEKVKNSLKFKFDKYFYWSDSTITLCWIKGYPERWKKFVSNRVGYIQEKTEIEDWFHVKSADNPADLISRGISAESLIDNSFWFEGPQWLKSSQTDWPKNETVIIDTIPEQKIQSNVMFFSTNSWEVFEKYSNLTKLTRVVALLRRFGHNLRHRKSERLVGPLDPKEIDDALMNLVNIAQIQSFKTEMNDLKHKGQVSNSSSIVSLHPFLHDNIMRVGGRIQKANLSFSCKHPIILHNNHKLAALIMKREHWRLMHCGPQQLLYAVRERFWPLSGRSLARQIVHKCIVCFKAKPKPCNYLMGNLPSQRLNQCTPFLNTGCDYAGYFLLKDRKTRGYKLIKVYVCIFVCLATKAVHLEPVTSLSSEAFLATLRRFIARRGKPLNIYSDNGTNFTGANSELRKFLKASSDNVKNNLANEGVKWHFIPPRAPHFGGLWEAGVKSFKQHLKRVVGNTYLDFEDFTTVLQQIEAVLNSRPLSPMSSSPDDVSPLTPGHFIIGRPLVSLPDPDLTTIQENRLSRFQRLQQMTQHFWNRWHKEYLSELQSRTKWKRNGANIIRVGDLVIIKDDSCPPLQWKLARVYQLFPGTDDVLRVIGVRFSDGTCAKRALNKVCPLPIDNYTDNNV